MTHYAVLSGTILACVEASTPLEAAAKTLMQHRARTGHEDYATHDTYRVVEIEGARDRLTEHQVLTLIAAMSERGNWP